ncbi:hypothetical protein PGT21_004764 [Puccinia graminis f. sp. tritici]|uniref:Uncharacterized protein n=1 Tax=Puccinia graminis f. sp. tritici TaxID=56615 RepID=A0A5B0NTE5_PUCGR|nr:hypothetical protein PGT21_004764 [Puccinia graminis f. sp. tritici]KAA1093592.1 hypothetical protein PGTUg99_001323 [Puccinia graminis f. sp. tritici]
MFGEARMSPQTSQSPPQKTQILAMAEPQCRSIVYAGGRNPVGFRRSACYRLYVRSARPRSDLNSDNDGDDGDKRR